MGKYSIKGPKQILVLTLWIWGGQTRNFREPTHQFIDIKVKKFEGMAAHTGVRLSPPLDVAIYMN